MVRLVDFDDPAHQDVKAWLALPQAPVGSDLTTSITPFAAALACYPIVSQLATYLDLNTLHELARTCRQVRAELLQHRELLIAQALRCANEHASSAAQSGGGRHTTHEPWYAVATAGSSDGIRFERITSGRVGACARDLVGECRRCNRHVCRNCVIKVPSTTVLQLRHRRLCRACMKAPLDALSTAGSPLREEEFEFFGDRDTHRIYARSPCECEQDPWICQTCGFAIRTTDTTYMRGWKWRTRYSTCGGFGAGLGEGNEGVECGRARHCLGAKVVEKEVECDPTELAALSAEAARAAEVGGRHWEGSSYSTQEVVGIGGKVVKKARKKVLVGAIVKEYEDERTTEQFLERERRGTNRSWCSWCERVIVSLADCGNRPIS